VSATEWAVSRDEFGLLAIDRELTQVTAERRAIDNDLRRGPAVRGIDRREV